MDNPYVTLLVLVLLTSCLLVAFKTRSAEAFVTTVFGSMVGAFLFPFAYTYLSALIVRLLKPIVGSSLDITDPHYGASGKGFLFLLFHLPIMVSVGLFGGVAITGIILIACQEAKQQSSRFSTTDTVVSAIATTVASTLLTMMLILNLQMLMKMGGWLMNNFLLFDSDTRSFVELVAMSLLMLIGSGLTSFLSAIVGTRFATFLISKIGNRAAS